MTFDNLQLDELTSLRSCLRQKSSAYSKDNTVTAMRSSLHALYFPEDASALAQDAFVSPFLSFLAFLMLHPEGGYRTIWDIPPLLSKGQFSMRLRASSYFKQTLDTHMKDTSAGVSLPPWFKCVVYSFLCSLETLMKLSPEP